MQNLKNGFLKTAVYKSDLDTYFTEQRLVKKIFLLQIKTRSIIIEMYFPYYVHKPAF